EMVRTWFDSSSRAGAMPALPSACLALGRQLEPDWLLLTPDGAGSFRLVAGCVCFPSSWSLEEKMGRPLEEIHGVVPGLNAQVGKPAAGVLSRMAPGLSGLRRHLGVRP